MNTVLFISDARAKSINFIDIVLLLKAKSNALPYFYFDDSLNDLSIDIETCKKINIPYFCNAIATPSNLAYLNLVETIKAYKLKLNQVSDFLKTNNITSVVTAEDNFGISTFFIAAANKLKIPTFVFPVMIANKEELTFSFSNKNYKVQKKMHKIFFKLFTNWCITNKGTQYFVVNAPQIIAQKLLKIAPKNIFIGVGGNAITKVFESQFMLEYYIKSGFTKTKDTFVLGSLKLDKLSNNFTRNLNIENIDITKKIILCALPPDCYPNKFYKSLNHIITHWLNLFCSQTSHQIIISLHPRTKLQDVEIIKQYPVIITNHGIENYIPYCDVFIANLSATIRYALACNKKILNFDFINVNYSEYKNITQVKTVFNTTDFETSFNQIILQDDYEKNESNYFGVLDGKSYERILTILNAA